jgi:hypothetical protein
MNTRVAYISIVLRAIYCTIKQLYKFGDFSNNACISVT